MELKSKCDAVVAIFAGSHLPGIPMLFRKSAILILITITGVFTTSCDRPAGTPQEAAGLLTAVPQWTIEEIVVNDAVTFKDGKMTQQFGSIDF